jgi:phenylacetate-CoA ligase
VITNAEPLFPWQSETIRRGLGCAVRETYGMAEAVAGASECSEGGLHLWPEVGSLEVLDDFQDRAAAPGTAGRLICTGLLNTDMPLVRYAVGDRATAIEKTLRPCACGRYLPTLGRVEGRTNDVLIAPDGRRIYWLNPVLYGLPIREAQIVQDAIDTIRVRYVPDGAFDKGSAEAIRERLRLRMGRVNVVLEPVPEIPRGENGKFRAVICRVPVPPLLAAS